MATKYVIMALVSLLLFIVPSKVFVEATAYFSIAIVGNVYCKCKFAGYDKKIGATPEVGDLVRVSCPNQNFEISHGNFTVDNGYFYINWPEVEHFDPNQCKAYLEPSAVTTVRPFCSKPIYADGKCDGASLSLVAENTVYGGIQGIYSPGIIYCGPPLDHLNCPFN